MRVMQVNSILNGGGVDNQTLELCKGLLDIGVKVSLATSEDANLLDQARHITGLEVHALRSTRPAFTRALRACMRTWRPHVAHAHHGGDYSPTAIAACQSGCSPQVVVSRHLMHPNRLISRRFLLSCADMVAVSKAVYAVQNATLSGPRERLHQIYGGVDCTRFVPSNVAAHAAAKAEQGWDPDTIVFGVPGYFNPPRGKGQMEFLQAVVEVHDVQPAARFVVVGSGGLLEPMQAFIADNQLQNVVRIIAWQSDVRSLFAGIDVLVYPVVEPEALGIVLWEAMACGLPVIASNLGGVSEAFEDERHGLLVPPGDVERLAAAMQQLGASSDLRRRYGEAGRSHVQKHYSTPVQAAHMLALYNTIAQRREPKHHAGQPASNHV